MATITCQQCGYANEAERIYCHNCGTKLDRSLLPPQKTTSKGEAKKMQRRVRKMVSPSRGFFAGGFHSFISSVVWALVVAAAIQIVRPPSDIPAVLKADDAMNAAGLLQQLQSWQAGAEPKKIPIPDTVSNGYLQSWIRSKKVEGLYGSDIKFERAFVTSLAGAESKPGEQTAPGVCRITCQYTIFNYPVYVSTFFGLSIKGGEIEARNLGGSVGNLPLHPMIVKYADVVFPKLWGALKREKKIMDGMEAIEVEKGRIVVVTKPSAGTR